MPIKGLTTNNTPGAGLPRIATLFKGTKKRERTNAKGEKYLIMGEDLPYFRVEFEPQFEHLRPLWLELYGEKPDSFYGVFLAGKTTDEAFPCWREEYNSSGTLIHKCDGESQVLFYDRRTGFHCTYKTECAAHFEPPCKCDDTGRLNLLIPEFIEAAGLLGYVSITTHSLNDILTLTRYLNDIEGMYGTLAGVPFVFGRAARDMSAPKTDTKGVRTGERIKVKKSLLHLYCTEQFTQAVLLPKLAGAALALPSGEMEPTALDNVVIDESEARKLLGGGGGLRRLGGPTVVSAPQPAAHKWTVEETTAFFTHARERHHLMQAQALNLLDVDSLVDFEGGPNEAISALDAAIAELDAHAAQDVS